MLLILADSRGPTDGSSPSEETRYEDMRNGEELLVDIRSAALGGFGCVR